MPILTCAPGRREFSYYQPGQLAELDPSIVVLGNDSGREERQIILEARLLGLPSVCIQEGAMTLRADELMNAECTLFAQGPEILKYVQRDKVKVTGNPKYDDLLDLPLPEIERVLINCSFAYGNDEEKRKKWVDDAVAACKATGLDFLIAQHPRDNGVFPESDPVIRSNVFIIKQLLRRAQYWLRVTAH